MSPENVNSTLDRLRSRGYIASPTRPRLFDFIDVVAVNPERHEVLGVVVVSQNGIDSWKPRAPWHDHVAAWLLSGGRIELWAWRRPNGAAYLRRHPVILSDLGLAPEQYCTVDAECADGGVSENS